MGYRGLHMFMFTIIDELETLSTMAGGVLAQMKAFWPQMRVDINFLLKSVKFNGNIEARFYTSPNHTYFTYRRVRYEVL